MAKKKPTAGTGGHGRKRLSGKGPTPKAEDRPNHKAYKARQRPQQRQKRATPTNDVVSGKNSVLESLRAKIPAKALMIANQMEMDDRMKEIISIANTRSLPITELTKPELSRLAGVDSVHQGVVLQVPPYNYSNPHDLITGTRPLVIACDGITDPRNLGAIIRSAAAFGASGVLIPSRRSVGMTPSAWKTSAGAAARIPVAMAPNLNASLKEYQKAGLFVVGLDGDGDVSLPDLELADQPLVVVVGAEGKGISQLVRKTCDQVVSIPISSIVESLNASVAASLALYEIAKRR